MLKKKLLSVLVATSALSGAGLAPHAFAQQATSLEEVVVTATKRDEMLQDVPVAVTAVTQAMIETNQITNVNDLGGMAPNLSVRQAAGGINLPTFNMRGMTSYGVVAGSDKQISIYLDGVYLGAPRGSIFSLPDIQQLEVLRGPQGTLFGRNATAGAISVTTRSPSGQLGFRQKVTAGSRDLFATETTIDTPQFGIFSAYLTYASEEQDGDIKNLGAGTIWNRSAFGYGFDKSPQTLGAKDNKSYFLALQAQPSDDVIISYKLDYATDQGTPAGTAPVGNLRNLANPLDPSFGSRPISAVPGVLGSLMRENVNASYFGNYTRPNAVNNAYTIARDQTVEGHNLTLSWDINDSMSLKNTFGYRKTDVFSRSDLGGGTWYFGPASSALTGGFIPVGTPFVLSGTQANSDGWHLSDEIQFDYDSDFVTVTSGLLYYKSDDESGSPRNSKNTINLGQYVNYVVPTGNEGVSFNEANSKAVFSQATFHLTDELDVLTGLRYTKDAKSGDWVQNNTASVPLPTQSFRYHDHQTSYLIGANYKVTDDILVYGKLSTAYVSGGAVSDIAFEPETSKSWEIGSKAEFLGGTLRTNIALFDVTYEHLQSPNGGGAIQRPDLSTLIIDGGTLHAQGAELEVTALPLEGLTLSAILGYQDANYDKVTPLNLASAGAGPLSVGPFVIQPYPNSGFEPTNQALWNGNLSANYETAPVIGSAYLSFGITGAWHDKSRIEANPGRAAFFGGGGIEYTPETWIVNARAALKSIEIASGWTGEVAVWGKNLTDDDHITFMFQNQNTTNYAANFTEERSFGIDFIAKY